MICTTYFINITYHSLNVVRHDFNSLLNLYSVNVPWPVLISPRGLLISPDPSAGLPSWWTGYNFSKHVRAQSNQYFSHVVKHSHQLKTPCHGKEMIAALLPLLGQKGPVMQNLDDYVFLAWTRCWAGSLVAGDF